MPLEISGSVSMIRPNGPRLITTALITSASGTSRTGVGDLIRPAGWGFAQTVGGRITRQGTTPVPGSADSCHGFREATRLAADMAPTG